MFAVVRDDKRVQVQPVEVPARLAAMPGSTSAGRPCVVSDPLIGVVPGPVMRSETPDSSLNGFLDLSGLLLGVAAVLLLFRADLFDFHEGGNGAVPGPSLSPPRHPRSP
ncbi:hypothetical protein [Streptomyces microflavus]